VAARPTISWQQLSALRGRIRMKRVRRGWKRMFWARFLTGEFALSTSCSRISRMQIDDNLRLECTQGGPRGQDQDQVSGNDSAKESYRGPRGFAVALETQFCGLRFTRLERCARAPGWFDYGRRAHVAIGRTRKRRSSDWINPAPAHPLASTLHPSVWSGCAAYIN